MLRRRRRKAPKPSMIQTLDLRPPELIEDVEGPWWCEWNWPTLPERIAVFIETGILYKQPFAVQKARMSREISRALDGVSVWA